MNGWIVLLTSEIDTLIQTNIHTHTAKAAAKQALEAKQKEDRENLAKELEEKKARETAQRKKSTAVNAAIITEQPSTDPTVTEVELAAAQSELAEKQAAEQAALEEQDWTAALSPRVP